MPTEHDGKAGEHAAGEVTQVGLTVAGRGRDLDQRVAGGDLERHGLGGALELFDQGSDMTCRHFG